MRIDRRVEQIMHFDQWLGLEKVRRQTRALRHLPSLKRSPHQAAAGFFRCFRGLCGWG